MQFLFSHYGNWLGFVYANGSNVYFIIRTTVVILSISNIYAESKKPLKLILSLPISTEVQTIVRERSLSRIHE